MRSGDSFSANPPASRAWATVAIFTLAYVFSFVDRQILALLVGPIKHDLLITDTQFGLLSGLAFALFYATAGIPIATLADSRSRSAVIATGLFIWSAATVGCGFAHSFLQLFVLRILVGAGEAALSPAVYSIIADLFPRERLGKAMGVYATGAFAGAGLGYLGGGWVVGTVSKAGGVHWSLLADLAPWQVAFVAAGAPGILLALLVVLAVRDPTRRPGMHETDASLGQVFSFIRANPAIFVSLYLGFSLCAMSLFATMTWAPAFLQRTFLLTLPQTGYRFGLVVLLGCLSGVLVSGALVDFLRVRYGRTDSSFMVGAVGAAGTAVSAFCLLFAQDLSVVTALLAAVMFFASFAMPTSTAAMQILAPPRMGARVSALFLFCNSLLGMALGTWLVGYLNDHASLVIAQSLTLVVGGASAVGLFVLLSGLPSLRTRLHSAAIA